MTCIGTAYGASPLTFLGLSGVGDLFLTCSSSNSRNYTVGYLLGQGEKLDVIMKTLGSVAEGVSTTRGVKKIIEELGINAPIANSVSAAGFLDRAHLMSCRFTKFYSTVSFGFNSAGTPLKPFTGKDTQQAVRELMELPPSRELELPPTAGGPARRLLKKLGLTSKAEAMLETMHPCL